MLDEVDDDEQEAATDDVDAVDEEMVVDMHVMDVLLHEQGADEEELDVEVGVEEMEVTEYLL